MLIETESGLYCPAGQFHIDPWGAVDLAVITHAHGDHARAGSRAYLCSDPCRPLLERRFGSDARIQSIPYGEQRSIGSGRGPRRPAGHVLGSAQIRIEGADGVWVIAGDYKRAT